MENVDYIQYGLYFGAMVVGVFAHMVKKLADLNKAGTLISPKDYFMKFPYQTTLSVLGGIAGYFLMISTGDMSYFAAILSGYTTDSVFTRKL